MEKNVLGERCIPRVPFLHFPNVYKNTLHGLDRNKRERVLCNESRYEPCIG